MKTLKTRFFTDFMNSCDEQNQAALILREGGLVVMPTETVYGLAANALDGRAVLSVFTAKGRPADNPLIVHISSIEQLDEVTASAPEAARFLFERFSPGPLTLVLPRGKDIPDAVTCGLNTVGVRIPSHNTARLLLEKCGLPLAAPSANRSGKISPTNFAMACAGMRGRVDAIIDGGQCSIGLESTVARVTEKEVLILRPGAVTSEMIALALPGYSVSLAADDPDEKGKAAPSPGMRYAHYQSVASVYIWKGGPLDELGDPARLAVIGLKGRLEGIKANFIHECETIEAYSADFYAFLSECDERGIRNIAAQSVNETEIGSALMNRLKRSAAGKTVPM